MSTVTTIVLLLWAVISTCLCIHFRSTRVLVEESIRNASEALKRARVERDELKNELQNLKLNLKYEEGIRTGRNAQYVFDGLENRVKDGRRGTVIFAKGEIQ